MEEREMQPVTDLVNEIASWKAKYGEHNVHQWDITTDDGTIETYIIRKPGRKEIDAMAHYKSNNDITRANNVLVSNCVLHGNKEVIERDGDIYGSLLAEIASLIKRRETAIKKL